MASKRLTWLYLITAAILAVLGLFVGYAAAVDGDVYLRLLGCWAGLTFIASMLFAMSASRGERVPRYIAIVALGLFWAAGVDPGMRLFHFLSR